MLRLRIPCSPVRRRWTRGWMGSGCDPVTAVEPRQTGRVDVPTMPRASSRTWERRYVRVAAAVDATAALVAGIVGLGAATAAFGPDPAYVVEAVLTPPLWVAAIAMAGGYDPRFLGGGPEEFRRVALGAFGLVALIGVTSWALDAEIARIYVFITLPLAIVLTPLGRYAVRRWVGRRRRRGEFLHRTVIVGADDSLLRLARQLADPLHGFEVLGACVPAGATAQVPQDVPVLGELGALVDVVRVHDADTVAVASSSVTDGEALRRMSWSLESTGATLVVSPGLVEVGGPRLAVRPVGGLPLLHLEHPRFTGMRRLVKGVYDPVVAFLGLVVLSPLLLGIAIAIKLDSPGPVLFRQVRVGEMGRPFTILKFRTMVPDAEQRKDQIAHLDVGAGPLFKVHSDPRVTRIGAWLRRTSLDELPQLLNVVSGRMSLVGPRPHLPAELEVFGRDAARRLFVKPGITGLWQVSGRSDLDWEQSVRLDLRYVENWTLTWDIYIMWKTIKVMARRSGAY
jgi:exopolysaccharide biosynthesis polyprenyl glycosylphosphotransferase